MFKKEMNIKNVKTCFKIMDALLINNKIQFKYLDKIYDENGNLLPQNFLTKRVSRVYLIVVNDLIYKIGSSEDKGGIKGTLAIYKDGGIKGRPSIRSYGIFCFLFEELKKGNKIEFYMIYQESIKSKIKGLFNCYELENVNISSKYIEEKCILDYKTYTNKLPKWNLQEQGFDWPELIKKQHALIIEQSSKRGSRRKK